MSIEPLGEYSSASGNVTDAERQSGGYDMGSKKNKCAHDGAVIVIPFTGTMICRCGRVLRRIRRK